MSEFQKSSSFDENFLGYARFMLIIVDFEGNFLCGFFVRYIMKLSIIVPDVFFAEHNHRNPSNKDIGSMILE